MSISHLLARLRSGRTDKTPLVFGHRGCAAVALENTLDAFRRARSDGVEAIELDIQLGRDGEVLVFHDQTLQRLGSIDRSLREFSAGDLREIPLTDERRGVSARGVPLLSEVIETVGNAVYIDIEIKSYPNTDFSIVDALVELIKSHEIAPRILVSSFDPRLIRRFRLAQRRDGSIPIDVPCAAIYSRSPEVPRILRRGFGRYIGGGSIRKPDWHDLPLSAEGRPHRLLPPDTIPWTVNDCAVARQLRDSGVAGIISDNPTDIL